MSMMSHEQRESKLLGPDSHTGLDLSPHSGVSRAGRGMAAGAAPGAAHRRLDWFACSVGGCEPRGIA
jgi:hypothetical protein